MEPSQKLRGRRHPSILLGVFESSGRPNSRAQHLLKENFLAGNRPGKRMLHKRISSWGGGEKRLNKKGTISSGENRGN